MLEKIKTKLDRDINCDLNIEELKLLYFMDNDEYENLDYYHKNRNNYKDFCKIFGKDFVAQSIDEINENTIAYVGNLKIDYPLPTYNLKYIYGNLDYRLDKVYNLENLEVIYSDAYFPKLEKAEGLENLRIVGSIRCDNLKNSEGLESLLYIGDDCYFESLVGAEGLESLQYIGGGAYFNSLISSKGLKNLKKILWCANFPSLVSADDLKSLQYIHKSAYFHSLKSAQCLEKLEYIGKNAIFRSLKSAKGLENLEYIGGYADFYSLESVDGLENINIKGDILASPEIEKILSKKDEKSNYNRK